MRDRGGFLEDELGKKAPKSNTKKKKNPKMVKVDMGGIWVT